MATPKTNPPDQGMAIITGQITRQDGRPLEEVNVTLIKGRDNKIKQVESDPQGHYKMDGIMPDTYILKFDKDNYESSLKRDLKIEGNDQKIIDLSLKEYAPSHDTKVPVWTGLLFWLAIFGVIGYNYFSIGEKLQKAKNLEILASQVFEKGTLKISGQAVFEGQKFNELNIWAVARDEDGNEMSPEIEYIDTTAGHFKFKQIALSDFGNSNGGKIINIDIFGRGKLKGSHQQAEGDTRLQLNTYGLDIIASLKKTAQNWVVEGKVLPKGAPIDNLNINVIAKNNKGERYSPDPDTILPTTGKFIMGPIPGRFLNDTLSSKTEITILATGTSVNPPGDKLTGKQIITMGTVRNTRSVDLSIAPFIITPLIFFFSVLLAIFEFKRNSLAFKYYSSIILAFLFTGVMIAYIAAGLKAVNRMDLQEQGEVASLGIASIFYGTYVNDVEPQWLFSLTFPSQKELGKSGNYIAKGFGAPLWVLLLSVIGAGLFTLNIIVQGVQKRISSMTVEDIRSTIQKILLHEFYIFFSPIGAIFVYQLLVASGAASQHITVAIAVLAAGLALNLLLEKALNLINQSLSTG